MKTDSEDANSEMSGCLNSGERRPISIFIVAAGVVLSYVH